MRSKKQPRDQRKVEKQISDELHRIFDDSDSFYYCLDADFTNNLQRKDSAECDDRFFWNKYMLADIIALGVSVYNSIMCLWVVHGQISISIK